MMQETADNVNGNAEGVALVRTQAESQLDVLTSNLVQYTQSGLVFSDNFAQLTPEQQYAEWSRIGDAIDLFEKSSTWARGDWLAYGEHQLGNKYVNASAVMKKDPDYLKQLKFVASHVPQFRYELSDGTVIEPDAQGIVVLPTDAAYSMVQHRSTILTFSHYRILAGLTLTEQRDFAALAEKGESDAKTGEHRIWSVKKLRDEVNKVKNAKGESGDTENEAGDAAIECLCPFEPFMVQYRKAELNEDLGAYRKQLEGFVQMMIGFHFDPEAKAEWLSQERQKEAAARAEREAKAQAEAERLASEKAERQRKAKEEADKKQAEAAAKRQAKAKENADKIAKKAEEAEAQAKKFREQQAAVLAGKSLKELEQPQLAGIPKPSQDGKRKGVKKTTPTIPPVESTTPVEAVATVEAETPVATPAKGKGRKQPKGLEAEGDTGAA